MDPDDRQQPDRRSTVLLFAIICLQILIYQQSDRTESHIDTLIELCRTRPLDVLAASEACDLVNQHCDNKEQVVRFLDVIIVAAPHETYYEWLGIAWRKLHGTPVILNYLPYCFIPKQDKYDVAAAKNMIMSSLTFLCDWMMNEMKTGGYHGDFDPLLWAMQAMIDYRVELDPETF